MATVTLPDFLVASKGRTSVVATPGTYTAGVFTPSTATQSYAGQLDSVRLDQRTTTQEINSMDSSEENTVIITRGTGLVLREILKGSGTNFLAALANGPCDFASFVWGRGAQAFTIIGAMTGYTEDVPRDKAVGELTISPVATTGTTPPVSYA